jgi:hypothetical protein
LQLTSPETTGSIIRAELHRQNDLQSGFWQISASSFTTRTSLTSSETTGGIISVD